MKHYRFSLNCNDFKGKISSGRCLIVRKISFILIDVNVSVAAQDFLGATVEYLSFNRHFGIYCGLVQRWEGDSISSGITAI
jgi:hypothetical protein